MKHASSNDPDDSLAVEITSLDTPEKQKPDTLLQGSRIAPRVRNWLTILSVVGGVLLVVVVLLPFWSSLLPKKTIIPPTPYVPSAQIQDVMVRDGITYITSSDGTLRALRVSNGSLLWQHHSVSMAPLILNDVMYIEYYDQNNITIQALRTKNASLLWTFKTSLDSEPLIIANGAAYPLFQYSSHGHIITAVNGSNGIELWHYTMGIAQSSGINIQGMQDRIYITTFPNAQVQSVNLFVLGMRDGLLLWHVKADTMPTIQNNVVAVMVNSVLKVLRADTGREIWRYKAPNVNGWSPITGNNLFYMQTLKGTLQALSIDTGTLRWIYKDPWGVAEVFPEVNGVIYLETGDGFIVALRISDGARLWHVRPVAPPFTFGEVQVVDGRVYTFTTIGNTQYETIAALNATDGSLLWRRKIGTNRNTSMSPQISNDLLLDDSGTAITALSTYDGKALWHVNYTPSVAQYTPNLLTFTDTMVIVQSSERVLEAHQLGTGALLWRYPHG